MSNPIGLISVSILLIFITISSTNAAQFNVASFGAKGDGKTDSTKAFLATWFQVCASTKPATMYIPSGKFLLAKTVAFEGRNNVILVRIVGILVAPSNYMAIDNAEKWIVFRRVNGVTVYGGVLDGQGVSLWACKASGKSCPADVTNTVIQGLTSLNSQLFHNFVYGCTHVLVQNVRVSASGKSPNTDGIHIQLSTGVTILNSRIKTGDDCISIAPGSSNLWVENIACGPGHGISIGSPGWDVQEPGVQNVTIKTPTFIGTQNGVRIKSWGRPSNGFARNILSQHIIVTNVQNPIVIDQNYCPDNKKSPRQASGVKISAVTYEDIHGTSATVVAVKFDCSKKNPCTGIKLKNVKLTFKNQPASASGLISLVAACRRKRG